MKYFRSISALTLPLFLLACAAPAKYNWGNYEGSLYRYYKDSATASAHMAELKRIIEGAEQTKAVVAPGIHAEYGYFLLQSGKFEEASAQFAKEKAKWPESGQLMDTMIGVANARANNALAGTE